MRKRIYFHKDGNGYCKKLTFGLSEKPFGFHICQSLNYGFIITVLWVRIHYKNIRQEGGRYPVK